MTLSPTYYEENQVQNIACYVQLSTINTNTKTFPTKPNLLQRTLKPKPRHQVLKKLVPRWVTSSQPPGDGSQKYSGGYKLLLTLFWQVRSKQPNE